jgi:hypothetical protein
VYAWWTAWASRSTNAPYDIVHSGGTTTISKDQRINGGKWNLLGRFSFGSQLKATLRVTSGKSCCADAIRFVPADGTAPPQDPPPPPQDTSALLSWDAPTQNVDGTTLTDLAGFRVYQRLDSGSLVMLADVGMDTELTLTSLDLGTYRFSVAAYDESLNEGRNSAEVSKTFSN